MQLMGWAVLAGLIVAGAPHQPASVTTGPDRYAHCAAYFHLVASCVGNAARISEVQRRAASNYQAAAQSLVRRQLHDLPVATVAMSQRTAIASMLRGLKDGCTDLSELVYQEDRQCTGLLDGSTASN